MSIYSGFGTREQEINYNNYLNKMILLIEKRVVWNIKESIP